ncbi:hypothetical protein CcaverHIS002_0602890 [Cutaneotrichosporon cavernicola]|uniref:Golgi apparatus membrane protein TVP38 n=1 Tax=Cutaneotrichosporon cavernicola TaxID=279322 RepID=A0AA48L8E2_9TREE|nr:uncharacterized protein CcaverHIS019_0602370 [Cutaneotrichosporon cavernicola]BEI86002.1 hypothetical protein CcaverHIS002_0602890 [Cutaneotrichosporon cavernicola]BEI93778.1 hypothetical protein CcaverHIS019_0602370 [Cutaneotrichosporon cavernicola]BEJ01556.1 hypothetical protein CcaverHIS631_0602380 [Cutaneotrichosporon cavernicola]BEJ09321.1 hypothetical protein CcaverHIS641_0602360 [Cutaneotrichosporon cavernicola]
MPTLSSLRTRFLRRSDEVEAQTECDRPSPTSLDEKATPLDSQDDAPPAYPFPAEKGRPSLALAIPNERQNELNSPIVQTTHDNMPTIMVLVKEDYEWARSYLKEFDYRRAARRATARHLYKWYILLAVVIAVSVLVSTKHTTIVEFCRPVTERIRSWPGGWLIPIAFLIIVSFPPLVGHEIIGILCGLVWGMWAGFGVLAAGTFLGEVATWIAFKWMCTARARKFERRNKLYGALTQLIREKSFTFVLILRFSAVPGHIVTAVSASAGANVWSYLAAAFLTLPKQWVIAYLGSSFGQHSKKNTYISWAVTIATFIGTIIAALYVYYQMRLLFRSGRMNELPHGDPREPGGWVDVEADGASGIGGALRVNYDDGGVRRSVDVVFGPHARAEALERRQCKKKRTRSLPGPITEEEMRDWLGQLDTALMASTVGEKGPIEDEPVPYSHLLLAPPGQAAANPGLPDLAHEHIVHSAEAVPAILLTPTYTPAQSRADSLRGTVSLDLERPRSGLVVKGEGRRRGESSAALTERPRADSRSSVLLVRSRAGSTSGRDGGVMSEVSEESEAQANACLK